MLTNLLQFINPVKFATQLFNWVKRYQADIILLIGVILISLLSFAAGYITAKEQAKTPVRIEAIDNK